MKLALSLLLATLPATCQTRPLMVPATCPTAAGQVGILAYAILPGTTVVSPFCLTLGAGFTIDVAQRTISVAGVTVTPPAATPLIQEFPLDPNTPAGTLTATFTLSQTPKAGTPVLAFFVSSQATASIATATPAANSNQAVVNLPAYRPFTATDRITIVYWAQ